MPIQKCSLCNLTQSQFVSSTLLRSQNEIVIEIENQFPNWVQTDKVCLECYNSYSVSTLRKKGTVSNFVSGHSIKSPAGQIIPPTPARMNANPYFTGRGVTICIIDSGFYAHPDLIEPENRIIKILDVTTGFKKVKNIKSVADDNWHGTMTAVTCAGNGRLSNGVYKGIASGANLILLKVKDKDGISAENITKALNWTIRNKDKYNIKIINMSITDDWDTSYKVSEIDKATYKAYKAGIITVAAVGNTPNATIKPPANSPFVIAVGGLDDHNNFNPMRSDMYHSTYGETIDKISKPELIAPAMRIAAPILPDTAIFSKAASLFDLLHSTDETIFDNLKAKQQALPDVFSSTNNLSIEQIKELLKYEIKEERLISKHYKHVDGTSFAAPLVCSVIAQMLEANRNLTPPLIREILLTTSFHVPYFDNAKQGYGIINAKGAVERAEIEKHYLPDNNLLSPSIDYKNKVIVFRFHDHNATRVGLFGSFTNWEDNGYVLRKERKGWWQVELPLFPRGKYTYKFLIDGKKWITDPRNPLRSPDSFNGFNSLFEID